MFGASKFNRLLPHPGYNKGGGSTTTVEKADPWEPIQPFLLEGANAASDLYNANPGGILPYGGDQVATLPDWLSGSLTSGINQALGSVPFYQTAMWNSLSSALNPQATSYQSVAPGQVEGSGIDANPAINNALYGNGMSPYLDQMAGSLVDRTQQAARDASTGMWSQLQDSILPQIESQFNQAGSLGASRQALMQGQAIGKTNDALAREYGDLGTNLMGQLANLYGGVYENAQNRSASLASQLAGLGTQERLANLGALMQSQLANQGAGLEAQGMDLQKVMAQMQTFPMLQQLAGFPMSLNQAAVGAYAPLLMQQQGLYDVAKNNYYETQMAPWNALGQYSSLINPYMGAGSTATSTQPTYSNPLAQAMSVALPLMMFAAI